MAASQSGIFSLQEFSDIGAPLVGGRLYTYAYGTTTLKVAYTDQAGSVAHAYTSDGIGGQYIALNARGELPAPLYLAAGSYDIALKDASGATIWTRRADPVDDKSSALAADLASTSDASKGAGMVGFIQSGSGAVARTAQSKLREFVSVKDFGAVGDGATDGGAAFANMEASTQQTYYLPDGQYLSGLSTLQKNYEGPGVVKLASGRAVPGTISHVMQPRYMDAMHKANAGAYSSPRNIVFIGDSITYGFGVTEANSYPCMIAQRLAMYGPGVGCETAAGASTLLRAAQSGTITSGTAGPIKQSLILDAGASLTFSVKDSDFFGFYYQRKAGAGTLTVTVNGVSVNSVNCSGAIANDVLALGSFHRTTGVATVVMSASGGPVELTGAFFSHQLTEGQLNVINQAASGYATSDFADAAVIASIGAQTPYAGAAYPVFVIALGTNDVYNPGKAVSSATYKSNLETICQGLRTYGIPVLTVPLRAVETTYQPVLESFDKYRQAVYELARKYGYFVIDLSEHDIQSTGGYQADGLHPNSVGHQLIASIYWQQLELYSTAHRMGAGSLTLEGSFTAFGGNYTVPSYDMSPGGLVSLSGLVSVGGSAKGSKLATLPTIVRPVASRLFCVAGLNGAAGASVYVQVNSDGGVVMFDYSSAALSQLSLEGITFKMQR